MHNKNSAMAFIVLLGVVSLFSDMTHEAATSIKGAYLLILGASASTIGFISGVGELLGMACVIFLAVWSIKRTTTGAL